MTVIELPLWAGRAKSLFKGLWVVYVLSWLVRGALGLIDSVFDTDLYGSPRWLEATVYVVVGIWLVSGLVWLAGALVAGYRDPR